MSEPVPAEQNVLVADDDPGVRYVIQWALEGEGMKVRTASSGDEAIERIEQEAPSLLVLDLTMPFRDGPAVARELNRMYGEVPILVVTADGHAPEKAAAIGAFAYLHKPFAVADLVSAVREGLAA